MMRITAIKCVLLLLCNVASGEQSTSQDDSVSLMQVHHHSNAKQGVKHDKDATASASEDEGQEDDFVNDENEKLEDEDDPVDLVSEVDVFSEDLKGTTCSVLKNQGAYFTVDVGIGTPPQVFNLVADTGSDALIIPDCRCVEHHYCFSVQACFAPEDSTSFVLDETKGKDGKGMVMGAEMDYGSGAIQVLISTDHANVASMGTVLHNGVFLMEDRRTLDVHGDFEGILGLGLPHRHPLDADSVNIPSFMDSATAVKSYSLCFNAWPQAGSMRTSPLPLNNPMQNIGTVHWGLALNGFSVGTSISPLVLCDPAKMPSTQQTACGALPDSGTTLLMGPKEDIHILYAGICDQWARCKSTVPATANYIVKSQAFHNLLRNCEAWMGVSGISEIPSIFFHMSGANGARQSIELTAWSYIVESTEDLMSTVSEKLYGKSTDLFSANSTSAKDGNKYRKVCSGSFDSQDYVTAANGPVWILGAPMFYAHNVGYSVKPPMISFMDSDCNQCGGAASSLLSTDSSLSNRRAARPRQIDRIKYSNVDTTKGIL